MILTCYVCPRQLSFAGSDRRLFASLFGWEVSGGRYFCGRCQGGDTGASGWPLMCVEEPSVSGRTGS